MNEFLSTHSDITEFFGCVPTLYATLRVTGQCNLYCKHCYASASSNIDTSNELTLEEEIGILKELKKHGVLRLSISGGEPFCRHDIYKLLKAASDLGFDIYISSNGTNCISVKELSQIRIKVFQVSLDGLEETHDIVRGKKGAFFRATSFLKEIQETNNCTIGIAFSLMKSNCSEALKLYKYIYTNKLADVFSVIPVQKLGRAEKSEVLSVFELHKNIHELSSFYLSSDRSVELNIMAPPAIVPKGLSNAQYGKGYVCEFPYSIAIDAMGNCTLCDGMLNFQNNIIANVRDTDTFLEKVIADGSLNKWYNVSPDNLEGICKKCCFVKLCCGGCRIDAYMNFGNVNAPDPLCQKYYEAGLFPKEYITHIK